MDFRRWLLLPMGLFVFLSLSAQQFGGNPPSLKWLQINTDTARIIFPKGLEIQAAQVASMVHALSRSTLNTMGPQQRKINIVFQNQTTISNGYVGLAPFRSEFQLTADQNSFELGSLPWQEQLAIHEYRHVEQYNNFRVGLSKAFYYLFGEGGQALANSLSVPNWFFEGDAVYQETLVSQQGRGRLPYFFNGYRSLWSANKNYSYLKLRNGSLLDYTPDHYPLGYILVAYGREKYGSDFWKKVSLDAASFKGLFYPWQRAIKKYAGISFEEFRKEAFNYFSADELRKSLAYDSAANYARAHRHFVSNEEFPQFIDDAHIVFVRASYSQPPAFVIRDLQTDEETKIGTKSISIDNYFSYKNNKIVYAAYEPDSRWGWRDYGVLRLLDLNTGKEKRITAKTKYFSPDISYDGKQIVAVEQAVNGQTSLVILHAETGGLEKKLPNKEELYFSQPKFYNEQQVSVAVRNHKGQMAIALVDMNNGSVDYLTPFSMNVVGFLSVQGDTVYFDASHEGQDQLFALVDHRLFKLDLPINNKATGNYQIQSLHGKYVWNTFTAVGYRIFKADTVSAHLTELSLDERKTPLIDQHIQSLVKGPADLLDKTVVSNYPISPYSQSFHWLNFNSWRPYVNDPDYMFSLESENILNTLQSEIFFDYNRNEGSKQLGLDFSYAQLFPWINGGINYTFDRNGLFHNKIVYWNEAQAKIGLSIPLNFSRGNHFTSLLLGDDLIYSQRYFQNAFKDSFDTRGFAYTSAYLQLVNQVQQGKKQIYPSFAQTLLLGYNRAFTTLSGNQFLASSYFYLPGFARTHSLVLAAAYQQRDSIQEISFSNGLPFSRGYTAENFYQMYRLGANYHFPIAYPDWGFGSIVYFLRVRANLFYDYTKVFDFYRTGKQFDAEFRSFGSEIYFDTNWWNQLPVSFGLRYSRLMDHDFLGRGPNQWELIIPISLLSK